MTAPAIRRVLGVIGHVDHGKTALVRALTGVDTDRLPEERRRGVSIALGFAHARIGEVEVDVVDMPGHERFLRTMVSGATGVDAVLLVVAANEGIKPQTVEHVEVAALLGLSRAAVAITKADLAAPGEAAAAAAAAEALLASHGIAAAPAAPVCAPAGQGLEALRAAICEALAHAPPPADDGFAYLPLDRAFSLPGHGTVATGTLRRGALTAEGDYELAPAGTPARLRGLQQHGVATPRAEPGGRLAVNLRGVDVASAGRGAALAPAGLLAASRWWTVALTAAASAADLATGVRLVLLHGAAEAEVRVRLLDRDVLAPGETALAQLHAGAPLAAPARERFILRVASPPRTVAGGRVLDPETRRLRRGDPAVLARLAGLAAADAAGVIRLELAAAGARGVSTLRLTRLAGVSPARAAALAAAADAVALRDDLQVSPVAFQAAAADLLRGLEQAEATQPNGVPRRRLAALAPGASEAVVDALVARLAAAGRLRAEGAAVRRALPSLEAVRARARDALRARVAEAARRGGLSPPDPEGPPGELKAVVEALVREGVLVRALDRVQKREVLFHRDAIARARAVLAPLLGAGGLSVGEAGAALGVSRRFSVPLLEHLDAVQFTRREGDRRVPGRAAA